MESGIYAGNCGEVEQKHALECPTSRFVDSAAVLTLLDHAAQDAEELKLSAAAFSFLSRRELHRRESVNAPDWNRCARREAAIKLRSLADVLGNFEQFQLMCLSSIGR